jgi:hypothetical protein
MLSSTTLTRENPSVGSPADATLFLVHLKEYNHVTPEVDL